MTTRSLCDFIHNFAAVGRTEEGYGNYYTIAGPTADVLLYFDESCARATVTSETVQVVLLRTKTPDGQVVIFHNGRAVQSKRRSDCIAPRDAAQKFADVSFELPGKILSVEEDLSNLHITNQNGKNFLIELPSGKYLITCLPNDTVNKSNLLTFIPIDSPPGHTTTIAKNYYTVMVPVSSTTTLASTAAITPEWIKENDVFVGGVWLINQGEAEIGEFNPTPEEIEDFCNKPVLAMEAPYYDALLSAAADHRANFDLKYEYGVPYNGEGPCAVPETVDQVATHRSKLLAWKSRADKFVHKYLAFDKKLFFGEGRVLSTSPGCLAQYYNDGVHNYIKGVVSYKAHYDRSIPEGATVLTNWHQMFSIVGNKSQLL